MVRWNGQRPASIEAGRWGVRVLVANGVAPGAVPGKGSGRPVDGIDIRRGEPGSPEPLAGGSCRADPAPPRN